MPMFPIDRWFSFEDRWPRSVVDVLLTEFRVTTHDVVLDPFAGCGTTSVAASSIGASTISCDVNPITALITHYKLNPPLLSDAMSTAQEIKRLGIRRSILDLSLTGQIEQQHSRLAAFLLATAILRTGWHLGKAWNEAFIRSELDSLLKEVREDTKFTPSGTAEHIVICGDFRDAVPEAMLKLSSRIIPITSPPFFGSDQNPRVLLLAKQLCLSSPSINHDACMEISDAGNAFLATYKLTPNSVAKVKKYLSFLEQIVNCFVELKCSQIAIEMSGTLVDGCWLPFDDFLSVCLAQHDYVVHLQVPQEGRQESERIVCGTRRRVGHNDIG